MSVNLSIEDVPEDLAERLRQRASENRRSLQGELMAIIEAAGEPAVRLTPEELLQEARRLGVGTGESSVGFIRAMRDGSLASPAK